MDVLFLVGAVVIGASAQFWRAVAIAGVQLVVLVVSVLNAVLGLGVPPIALLAVYLVCAGLGFATYLQGLRLDKEHPRRETCELLGASSVFGGLAVLAGIALVVAAR